MTCDRQTLWLTIVVFNQTASPKVHWIIGRLHAKKNQGPKSRNKKVILALKPLQDRQIDIEAYRGNTC